ncbi:MAG: hypothetical protein NZM43_11860 [Saprospiraceae bacterium]|nr:hypothetical protein [Saprospiraceae bacterium]MDW8485005.1 hypothetical protein [Saprospiraceae bacterium]
MLNHWLKPLPRAFGKYLGTFPPHTLGHKVRVIEQKSADLAGVQVALVGAGERQALAVREFLYRMTFPHAAGKVADLGDVRADEATSLRAVVAQLLSARILPIVVASSDDLARIQFLAYEEEHLRVNLAIVDERIRIADPKINSAEECIYTALLRPPHPLLFHCSLIGYQIHYTPEEWVSYFSKNQYDLLRLGKSRAAIEEAEPLLRDADLLCFHVSALKASEAPGVRDPSPSGYTWEEACQLSWYAGMSDKLTSLGVYGFVRENCSLTAQGIAQLIWFFLNGFFNRKGDFPFSTEGLKEYVVDFRGMNSPLTFWKSVRTGRWWFQAPSASPTHHERHFLVPCSLQDYQTVCAGELPERLMRALQRFS